MNLKARRVSGNSFTAEDILEVVFNSEEQPIDYVVHSVEVVSGVPVLHGGGAKAGDFLHYKKSDEVNSDNVISDYSNILMNVTQETQGISVIKVVAEVVTVAMMEEYIHNSQIWQARLNASGLSHDDFEQQELPPVINSLKLKTSDITLTYNEDTFV